MNKTNISEQKRLWLVLSIIIFSIGVGGGISNYSDNGPTIPVLMQIGGGHMASVF